VKAQEEPNKIKGQRLIEKEAVETGKVRRMEKEAEGHCTDLDMPGEASASFLWPRCSQDTVLHRAGGQGPRQCSVVVED